MEGCTILQRPTAHQVRLSRRGCVVSVREVPVSGSGAVACGWQVTDWAIQDEVQQQRCAADVDLQDDRLYNYTTVSYWLEPLGC